MASKFWTEFKEFAMKGNVIDMAVGVIIGGAFGKIVSSLVNDVIMPVVGLATGGIDFKEHKYVMKEAVMKIHQPIQEKGRRGSGRTCRAVEGRSAPNRNPRLAEAAGR